MNAIRIWAAVGLLIGCAGCESLDRLAHTSVAEIRQRAAERRARRFLSEDGASSAERERVFKAASAQIAVDKAERRSHGKDLEPIATGTGMTPYYDDPFVETKYGKVRRSVLEEAMRILKAEKEAEAPAAAQSSPRR